MMHDLNVKTDKSYGTRSQVEIVEALRLQGVTMMACTDLFTVSEGVRSTQMRVYSGSEWYTKFDGEGVERVDLLFLNYHLTDPFRAWVRREILRMRGKWSHSTLSNELSWSDSCLLKREFGQELLAKGLRRAYFGALPILDQVVAEFTKVGASFILSDIPFVTDFAAKCKIVRYLKTLGLMGMIVFKDENSYEDLEKEIQQSIDLCTYAGILPIVGTGVYANYDLRRVACGTAKGAFDFLTRQIVEKLGANYSFIG